MRVLVTMGEIWSAKGNEYQGLKVIYTEGSEVYSADVPGKRMGYINDSPDGVDAVLNKLVGNLIPVDHIYPVWREGLTEFSQPIQPENYVKTSLENLLSYNGNPLAANLLLSEIEIYELLSKNSHPNLCTYYGCIRAEDRIKGLCIQKHNCSLSDAIRGEVPADQCPPIDAEKIITGIKGGLDHIHSLGYVHDDIRPENIVLDNAGNPIIIDFNTCVAVGASSVGGSSGWSKWPRARPASIENDTYSFDLVVKFIRLGGAYDGEDSEEEETSPQGPE